MLVQVELGETCNAYSSWGSGGAVSPSAGPGQSPGEGPEGEAPRESWGLAALQQQKQLEIPLYSTFSPFLPVTNILSFLRSLVFPRQIIGLVGISVLNFQWQVQKNQEYVTLFR